VSTVRAMTLPREIHVTEYDTMPDVYVGVAKHQIVFFSNELL